MLKECKVLLGLTLTVFLLFFTGCGDMFDFSTETPDITAPKYVSSSPGNDDSNVSTSFDTITINFNEGVALDNASLSCDTYTIPITYTVSGGSVTLSVLQRLPYQSTCTATVNVRDGADNTSSSSISFTSIQAPQFVYHTTPDDITNSEIQYDSGRYNSVKQGPDGFIYISFYDATNDSLKLYYTPNNGTDWYVPSGFSPVSGGRYSELLFDSNGKIHIIHTDGTNLIRTTNAGGAWATNVIDSGGAGANVGDFLIAVKDGGNNIHVAYYSSTGYLRYARIPASGTINLENLENIGSINEEAKFSVKVDSSGYVHITYYAFSGSNQNLKYATNETGTWKFYSLDTTGNLGRYSSIALYNNEKYVVYTSEGDNTLRLLYTSGGTWLPGTTIPISGFTYAPFVIDDNGIGKIAYYKDAALYYGEYKNIASDICRAGTGGFCAWEEVPVDSSGIGDGIYTSLTLDNSTTSPYISYYDSSTNEKDLKFAHTVQ